VSTIRASRRPATSRRRPVRRGGHLPRIRRGGWPARSRAVPPCRPCQRGGHRRPPARRPRVGVPRRAPPLAPARAAGTSGAPLGNKTTQPQVHVPSAATHSMNTQRHHARCVPAAHDAQVEGVQAAARVRELKEPAAAEGRHRLGGPRDGHAANGRLWGVPPSPATAPSVLDGHHQVRVAVGRRRRNG